MRPVTARRGSCGFTLIEVLVALAIVGLGMSAVLGALGSAADATLYLRDRTFAEWVGLNHLAEVRLRGTVPPTGKSDGDLEYAGRRWHWRQEVEATQVQGMVRIDVKVRPADSKGSEDRNWYATVTGISGDGIGPPRDLDVWGIPGGGPQLPGGVQLPNGAPASFRTLGAEPGQGLGSGQSLGSGGGVGLGGGSGQLGSDLPSTAPADSGLTPDNSSPPEAPQP